MNKKVILSQNKIIIRAWFKTGAYVKESLQDYKKRLRSQQNPEMIFLRPQAD